VSLIGESVVVLFFVFIFFSFSTFFEGNSCPLSELQRKGVGTLKKVNVFLVGGKYN
jgi:hypothetical protein